MHKADAFDNYIPLRRLAHIVNRQGGYACCRHGLHLNACGAGAFRRGEYVYCVVFVVQLKAYVCAGQGYGMAHGYNVRGAFCAHYAGYLCGGEHIPLFYAAGLYECVGIGIEKHAGFGCGGAEGIRLFGHVYHAGPALMVKVGEFHVILLYGSCRGQTRICQNRKGRSGAPACGIRQILSAPSAHRREVPLGVSPRQSAGRA